MTTTLRSAREQLELTLPAFAAGAAAGARVVPTDEAAAIRLLRSFGARDHAPSLRGTLGAVRPGYDVRLLPEDVLLREVASCLARGRIHAYRAQLFGAVAVELTEPEAPRARIEKSLTWIEIVLKDTEGHPVPNERYLLVLPDGAELEGTLDGRGRAFLDLIPPGKCKVSFPDLDGADWRRG